MTSGVAFRVQNNRDRFFIHVSDDDFDIVKGRKFKISFIGAAVMLRPHPSGAIFIDRWGREVNYTGFINALCSTTAHPFFPLFGPFEHEGEFDASGNLYIRLPGVLELPWPSRMASKYEFDDDSCDKLLNDRVNALRGMQLNCLPIPDYMAVFIGYNRLKALVTKHPWLDIVRVE